jgi:hypothetical protein
MAEREQSNHPTHRAFTVVKRDGQEDFWLNIGSVFMHKDNGGFNVVLQALPIDGRIVCREIDDDRSDSRSEHRDDQHDGQVRNRPSRRSDR